MKEGLKKFLAVVAGVVLGSQLFVMPVAVGSSSTVDVYTTEGYHVVNGREWRTSCEKYSSVVDRCFTEIKSAGRWVHNNLTYLPVSRSVWKGNPLGGNGNVGEKLSWVSNGRQWRVECDTPNTGRNGCRSYILNNGEWVFNNLVLFGNNSSKTPETKPSPSVPTPTPIQPNPSGTIILGRSFPNVSTTGVPSGVKLTKYNGPLTITVDNSVIDGKVVTGNLRIQAKNVVIRNSVVNGSIDLRNPKTVNHSFKIVDSEVHVGENLNTGLMRGNFVADGVEVTGGRRSIYCEYNCVVQNSLVHKQSGDPNGNAHFSGIRMEQNGTFRNNTITCEADRAAGTGCSAGLTGYGDFAPVKNNLIQNNLFTGGSNGGSTICAYGGSSGDDGKKPFGHLAENVKFIDNVFVKGRTGQCGTYGAILSFDNSRPNNEWRNNLWDDGTYVSPRK